MSEAVALFSQHIFDALSQVDRQEASVYAWNPGSRKVLEANGFEHE